MLEIISVWKLNIRDKILTALFLYQYYYCIGIKFVTLWWLQVEKKNKSWFKEHLGLVEFLVFTLYISLPRPESYPVHTDWILITIFELIEVTFSYNYKYSGKTKSLNWKLPNLFENLYPIYCKVYLYSFIKYVLYTYLLFYII